MPDAIKEVKIIKSKNAIARVYIPDLTEEERSRRMKEVYKAAEALIKASIDSKRKREEKAEEAG